MNISVQAIANGFVLTVATRQGTTIVHFPYEDYEKMQKEIADVISEFEASRREFIAAQTKQQ